MECLSISAFRSASASGILSSDLLTFLKDTLGIMDDRATASAWSSIMSLFLTLYWPFICLMTSWESMTNSASSAPSSMALEIPEMSPLYSA